MRYSIAALCLCVFACSDSKNDVDNIQQEVFREPMYIGTYTRKEGHVDGKADGIYFIASDGTVQSVGDDIVNPSYVHLVRAANLLFAVSEIGGAGSPGLVVAYRVQADHGLQRISQHQTSGPYPCHVTSTADGSKVFVSNYGGGVDMFAIDSDSLRLLQSVTFEGGSDHPRQDASHPHMALLHEPSATLYVSDLGTNRVYRFEVARDSLIPARQSYFELKRHTGPRHLALHPDNTRLYALGELSSTVDVLSIDPDNGSLIRRQSVPTLQEDANGNSTAAIRVHPTGDFLWCSNRGHNSISSFRIDDNGLLEFAGTTPTRGEFPRDFNISPDGKWLLVANQNSDNIVRYRIDAKNGSLSYDGQVSVKTPVCIAFGAQ